MGDAQQRPGCAGVHLGLPALSLTPFPGAPRAAAEDWERTVCVALSPGLLASRAKPALSCQGEGPCLRRPAWAVWVGRSRWRRAVPCPSWNAGFVSHGPSWLRAAGETTVGCPCSWLLHPSFGLGTGSGSCREGGTRGLGHPQERAAKPEPSWSGENGGPLVLGVYVQGTWAPWTAGVRDSPFPELVG